MKEGTRREGERGGRRGREKENEGEGGGERGRGRVALKRVEARENVGCIDLFLLQSRKKKEEEQKLQQQQKKEKEGADKKGGDKKAADNKKGADKKGADKKGEDNKTVPSPAKILESSDKVEETSETVEHKEALGIPTKAEGATPTPVGDNKGGAEGKGKGKEKQPQQQKPQQEKGGKKGVKQFFLDSIFSFILHYNFYLFSCFSFSLIYTIGGGGGGAAKEPAPQLSATEDVSRLDIRVGLIKTCRRHENADSLYIEEIDVGEDAPRQVVSGLVKFVPLDRILSPLSPPSPLSLSLPLPPSLPLSLSPLLSPSLPFLPFPSPSLPFSLTPIEMQNRPVLLLCNLKPANLKGVRSQAMVLAASNEDHTQVELVDPPAGAKVGERVTFAGYSGDPEKVIPYFFSFFRI